MFIAVTRVVCLTLVTSAILTLVACKPGIPYGVLSPGKMEEVLYDYHLAQGMAETQGDSVAFRRYVYVQEVFKKHGITQADFDSSMIWYSAHAAYLDDIYKRLTLRYESDMKAYGTTVSVGDNLDNLSARGDTANIWPHRSFYVIKPNWLEDKLTFTIKSDSNINRGDEFLWRCDVRFVGERDNNGTDAYAALYVCFDNDSVAAVTKRIYNNSQLQLRITTDTSLAVSTINGYVYLKKKAGNDKFRMMLLDNIVLVRFHRHFEPVVADTLVADTLSAETDSLKPAAGPKTGTERRLSPTEFRESQPVERSINVVKEKPYKNTGRRRQTVNR